MVNLAFMGNLYVPGYTYDNNSKDNGNKPKEKPAGYVASTLL